MVCMYRCKCIFGIIWIIANFIGADNWSYLNWCKCIFGIIWIIANFVGADNWSYLNWCKCISGIIWIIANFVGADNWSYLNSVGDALPYYALNNIRYSVFAEAAVYEM